MEYIYEVQTSYEGKTKKWRIIAKKNDIQLGIVKWWGRWRKYAFFPNEGTVFEQECLRDIAIFIETRTWAHKTGQY